MCLSLFQAAITKIPSSGGLNNKLVSLTVLEAESAKVPTDSVSGESPPIG